MPQTYETPPYQGGARSDQLPGISLPSNRLSIIRVQHLTGRFGFTAHRSKLLADLAYGEGRE